MATVVTCYYNIPSKFIHETYMEWISNFMTMDFKSVIYCDKKSFENLSAIYPVKENRNYRLVEIDDFYVSKFNWDKDYDMDPEKSIHSIELYKVWAEKVFFVDRAINENIYNTDYFVWTDIGSFRNKDILADFEGYPCVNNLPINMVTFLLIEHFSPDDILNLDKVDNRFLTSTRVGGGIFGGNISSMKKFKELSHDMLIEFDSENIFKGKDQNLFAFIILRNPGLFNVIKSKSVRLYSRWFYLHYYLSGKSTNDINTCDIKDIPVTYICPNHNEKYKKRNQTISDLLKNVGFTSITHYQSGSEQYPKCLVEATINILELHLDDKPFLLVEDDIAWTGVEKLEVPPDADAIYLGISFSGGHPTENIHNGYCEVYEYSDNLCRVLNMLSAHAVLYISKRYKQAVLEEMYKIRNIMYHGDVVISRIQRLYNVYATNFPVFYQDDDGARDITKIQFRFNCNLLQIKSI